MIPLSSVRPLIDTTSSSTTSTLAKTQTHSKYRPFYPSSNRRLLPQCKRSQIVSGNHIRLWQRDSSCVRDKGDNSETTMVGPMKRRRQFRGEFLSQGSFVCPTTPTLQTTHFYSTVAIPSGKALVFKPLHYDNNHRQPPPSR